MASSKRPRRDENTSFSFVDQSAPSTKRPRLKAQPVTLAEIKNLQLGLSTVHCINGLTVAVTVPLGLRANMGRIRLRRSSCRILPYFTAVYGRKYGYHYKFTLLILFKFLLQ